MALETSSQVQQQQQHVSFNHVTLQAHRRVPGKSKITNSVFLDDNSSASESDSDMIDTQNGVVETQFDHNSESPSSYKNDTNSKSDSVDSHTSIAAIHNFHVSLRKIESPFRPELLNCDTPIAIIDSPRTTVLSKDQEEQNARMLDDRKLATDGLTRHVVSSTPSIGVGGLEKDVESEYFPQQDPSFFDLSDSDEPLNFPQQKPQDLQTLSVPDSESDRTDSKLKHHGHSSTQSQHRGSMTPVSSQCDTLTQSPGPATTQSVPDPAKPVASKAQRSIRAATQADVIRGHDDEHHDYVAYVDEILHDRYVVRRELGKGAFGRVLEAYDPQSDGLVAIKVCKSHPGFHKQAKIEIAILEQVMEDDYKGRDEHIVHMLESFEHAGHLCIVFEKLASNLYELLRATDFSGVPLNLVRKFAKQLLKALNFTAQHKGGLVHCDIKPENVLLCDLHHTHIKIIDFGSSCYADKPQFTSYIQSRYYRAPEIVFAAPYNQSIDMWSLACTLMELLIGRPLFNAASEPELILQLIDTIGPIPEHVLESGKRTRNFFKFVDGQRVHRTVLKKVQRRSRSGVTLRDFVDIPRRACNRVGQTSDDLERFLDLIQQMLRFDPRDRLTPAQALSHNFFSPRRVSDPADTPPASLRKTRKIVESTDEQLTYSCATAATVQVAVAVASPASSHIPDDARPNSHDA
jgi:dual specificity tyrosine-phosphorylation-regulated kinase 1